MAVILLSQIRIIGKHSKVEGLREPIQEILEKFFPEVPET